MRGRGDGASRRVGVDVVGFAIRSESDRGNHGYRFGRDEIIKDASVNLRRRADEAEIGAVCGGPPVYAEEIAVLAGESDGAAVCLRISETIRLLTEPARTISTTSIAARVRYTMSGNEARCNSEPVKHVVDLRAAAMHDNGLDAALPKQGYVERELPEGFVVRQGRSTELYQDDPAAMAPDMGQRLGERGGRAPPVPFRRLV